MPGVRARRRLAFSPLAGESDAARLSRPLHVFLVLSAAVTATFLVLTWTMTNWRARTLSASLLLGLGVVAFLRRRGLVRLAAAAYLLALWAFVTTSLALFGAWRTPAASAYAVVALAAALLLGSRGAAVAAAGITASCVAIAFADTRGWLPQSKPPTAWLAVAVLLASLGTIMGMAFYATAELRRAIAGLRSEIHERRSAEERLLESEASFRSIVDSSPMGIHLYRLEAGDRLVLTGCNPAGSRICGVEEKDLVGRTLEEAFPALAETDAPAFYRRLCAEGGSWTSEVPYRDEHGGCVYEVHAFQTAPGSMAAMLLDVTEKQRAAEERRRLENQLRQSQKMEAVGRLAGGIAHDFNNLLMVIMGHGELLRKSLAPEDPRLKKVEHVMGASERAARVVRQLLAFSRKQVMEPQVVDLNVLVSDTARLLRPLLGEDVRVVTRLRSARARVHVDPAQIDQVLVNLAVNARDAMPAGGALFLETEDVEPATPDGPGDVLLTVRDTGQGMDDSVRSQVFEPFFTTKAASGGTGLGLSMVYGIVQQSGGHIEVDSSPGSGSSFRIRLPGARERRVEASEPRAALPPSGKGETILVVEDEAVIRALACEMLETQGYRALEVASAEEALSLAERHAGPVDLLVTDVVMPGLGGPALAERFCALRPGTRVLFISGWAGDDLARRGFSEDRAPILPKPFTAEQLSQTVRAALDR